jgi:hypothetical protein
MTTTEYADPAAGNGDTFKPAEHKGALLLITNIRQEMDVVTEFGTANPIACNIAVLDGEHKADTYTDTFLFGVALINKLKAFADTDKKVLARLGQGDAKPGRSAPWILEPGTDADKETARKYEEYAAKQAATDEIDLF